MLPQEMLLHTIPCTCPGVLSAHLLTAEKCFSVFLKLELVALCFCHQCFSSSISLSLASTSVFVFSNLVVVQVCWEL